MAAQGGKKGKKSKGKTLNLNEFLSDGKTGGDDFTTIVAAPKSSWADEMDDYDSYPTSSPSKIVLPTAPRAARGPDIDEDRIPRDPPFSAYVANLPYDIDEEDLREFFSKLNLKEVRLPRDGDPETGRLKGFGYADFSDRASLIDALTMTDQTIKNRKIRVDLASGAGRDGNRMGGRMGGSRYDTRGDDEEDRTTGDWRSGPRSDPEPSRGGGRDSYERRDRPDGGRGGFERYESPRDRLNVREDRDDRRGDRGSGFETDFDRSQMRSANERPPPRDNDRRGGGGFDRYERRDGGDRYGGDRNDRGFDRSSFGGRRSPNGERDAPKERPRLQLAKRSEKPDGEDAAKAPAEGKSSSAIFGGAKPVDTARKEKEIEEKLKKDAPPPKEEEPPKKAPVDIFGAAKPVDTTAREREIEERLRKKEEEAAAAAAEKGKKDEEEGEKRKPGPRKVIELNRKRGDGERRETRDERPPRKERSDRSPVPMKKVEEKPVDIVSSNKFQFLQDEEEAGSESGKESE